FAFAPVVSSDGRYVAYSAGFPSGVDGALLSGPHSRRPDINPDYETFFVEFVYLYDSALAKTTFVGGNIQPEAPFLSFPSISGDGNFVAYVSTAANLVPGQNGPAGVKNVFQYDRLHGTQALVSPAFGSATTTAGGASTLPVTDRDGHLVSFASTAGNLIPGQT